jgi:hypothetical protein
MATHRQRNRKLARARFHSAQCKERNRSGRGFALPFNYDDDVNDSVIYPPTQERRSAVITEEINHNGPRDLNEMTRDELRTMAATLNIRGRSIMTKAALINAISDHS